MRKLLVGVVNGRSRFKTGRLSRLSSGRLLACRGTQNLLSRLRLRRRRGSHNNRRTSGTGRRSQHLTTIHRLNDGRTHRRNNLTATTTRSRRGGAQNLRGTRSLFLRVSVRDARQLTAESLGCRRLDTRYRSHRSGGGSLRYRGVAARGAEAQRHIRARRMSGRLCRGYGGYGSRNRCGLRRSGNGAFYLVRSRNIRARSSLSRGISRLGGSLRRRLSVGRLGIRVLIVHVSRLRRHRSRNRSRNLSRLSRRHNRRIRGRKRPHISEGRVILHQIVKVISGKLIHINRRKFRSNRLTRQTVRRGRLLLQVNTGVGIHAAQLTNHHGTSRRRIASLQSLRNSAALSTQTLHSTTPQRHTTHQRQHRLKARLTHRREQTHQQLITRTTHHLVVERQQKLQEVTNRQIEIFHLLQDLIHLREGGGLRVNTRNRPAFQQNTSLHQVTSRVTRAGHVQAQSSASGGSRLITQMHQHFLAATVVQLHQIHIFQGAQSLAGTGTTHTNSARNFAIAGQILAQLNVALEQFVLEPAQNFTMNSHVNASFGQKVSESVCFIQSCAGG